MKLYLENNKPFYMTVKGNITALLNILMDYDKKLYSHSYNFQYFADFIN